MDITITVSEKIGESTCYAQGVVEAKQWEQSGMVAVTTVVERLQRQVKAKVEEFNKTPVKLP